MNTIENKTYFDATNAAGFIYQTEEARLRDVRQESGVVINLPGLEITLRLTLELCKFQYFPVVLLIWLVVSIIFYFP